MADSPAPIDAKPTLWQRIPLAARLLITALAAMWVIELIDTFVTNNSLQRNGIHPRQLDGLDGIVFAPVLHSTFGHLISNSVPFAVLGLLVAIRGIKHWLMVNVFVIVIGGGLTWLLAGGGNHIGASGVVFGYFGALVGAAIFERRPSVIAAALVAILMYSGILVGIVPQNQISWEGHLFGLLAGVLVSRRLAGPRKEPKPDIAEPWEASEPWRTD